jgi:hypothetical protein
MLPYFNFEQYKEFYENNGRTVDQMQMLKSFLNERQLKSKFEKYLKKLEKQRQAIERQREKMKNKEYETDEKWEEVKRQVRLRDNNQCNLWNKTNFDEKEHIYKTVGNLSLLHTLDPAHVFNKSVYPHMKYDTDNVVLLNRLFHGRLDHFTNPITGKSITKEEQERWWRRIIGNNWYDELLDRSKNE